MAARTHRRGQGGPRRLVWRRRPAHRRGHTMSGLRHDYTAADCRVSAMQKRTTDYHCVACEDDPAASAADAPADTALRDQIAQYARDQTTLRIFDALLPLL